MTETKAPDYITSIRNELEDLEAKLERVELIASRAEREIPDRERRRRYLVTDALMDSGEAAGELANVESMIAAARLEHERASKPLRSWRCISKACAGSCAAADAVLVVGQSSGVANGIYTASAAGWSRHADYDTGAEFIQGMSFEVREGT